MRLNDSASCATSSCPVDLYPRVPVSGGHVSRRARQLLHGTRHSRRRPTAEQDRQHNSATAHQQRRRRECAASVPHTTAANSQSTKSPAADDPCPRPAAESHGTLRRPPDPTTNARSRSSPGCTAAPPRSAERTCPLAAPRPVAFAAPQDQAANRAKNDLRDSDRAAPACRPADRAQKGNSCPAAAPDHVNRTLAHADRPHRKQSKTPSSPAILPASERRFARSTLKDSRTPCRDSQTSPATAPKK